jgi:hypothetical protein
LASLPTYLGVRQIGGRPRFDDHQRRWLQLKSSQQLLDAGFVVGHGPGFTSGPHSGNQLALGDIDSNELKHSGHEVSST